MRKTNRIMIRMTALTFVVVLFFSVTGSISYVTASISSSPGYKAASFRARELAEKLLENSGGREVWKSIRSLRALAINKDQSSPLPYLFEIRIDFEQPGTIFRIVNQDMNRMRVYGGTWGWGVKESDSGLVSYQYSSDRLSAEKMLWEGAFSRNIWRVAKNDTTLTVDLFEDSVLVFGNSNGSIAARLTLSTDGSPVRLQFGSDGPSLSIDGYASFGHLNLPKGGTTAEGTAFETIHVTISPDGVQLPSVPVTYLPEYSLPFGSSF